MELSFEQALFDVWRQSLVEKTKNVQLGSAQFAVRLTAARIAHELRK